ncbi:ATP synthase subunit f, mitochondrial [Nakaseomyces bracarensis]|uniref:ATP synthase subunit f, mitochondrial n=1 Tax=Nakaseomyces bracarensis TaxID=273131 RepID=A0ABR4NSP4_9SACH
MIFKRAASTLIPPKIVSAQQLGAAPNAKRIANVVSFYKSLPQGSAPAVDNASYSKFLGKYKSKFYDGDNASGKPIWHLSVAVITLGYTLEYFFHLRHHKDH